MNQSIFMEPPNYYTDHHIFDFQFHPNQNLIGLVTVQGFMRILEYSTNNIVQKFENQIDNTSLRSISFSKNGQTVFYGSKDGHINMTDLNKFQNHEIAKLDKAIYTIKSISDNIVAVGQDNGRIQIYDARTNLNVYNVKEQEHAITDIIVDLNNQYLFASSIEGTLAVYDLRKDQEGQDSLEALSDKMEGELNCLLFLQDESQIAVGSTENVIQIYKKGDYGDCSDRIVGFGSSIDSMIKNKNDIVYVGCEDGWVRVLKTYPHEIKLLDKHADEQDEEQMPIDKLSLSHCERILGSISHDFSIKFYDLTEFEEQEDQEKIEEKTKIQQQNLNEKSKQQKINNIDFFSELCQIIIKLIHFSLL